MADGNAGARSTWWKERWGNFAQCASAIISLAAFFVVFWFHYAEGQSKASDEHVNSLIEAKTQPAATAINSHIDVAVQSINEELTQLTGRVGNVEGQLQVLRERIGRQEALNRIQDPDRILGIIRADIKLEQDRKGRVSASQLADYKAALQALPSSAREYWTTVAEVINYQSLLNQMSGAAPDPTKVAKPCPTGSPIRFSGLTFQDCIVDLDRNAFEKIVFRDSVVRYRGGPVSLKDVTFVNCRFMLELPQGPLTPAQQNLVLALLNSPDQKTVQISP